MVVHFCFALSTHEAGQREDPPAGAKIRLGDCCISMDDELKTKAVSAQIDLARADLDLAFTLLQTASIEEDLGDVARHDAAKDKVRSVIVTVRGILANVVGRVSLQESELLRVRVDELEAALQRI
jgi:hypothetical protein